ncbi:MAG: DUF3486 family protein [Gallionellaceae bacterium]|nr:DUF3486 family protein [Gallionellaceae bacterium]
MARASKIMKLPPEVLEELNARLISGGFNDYEGLSDWLKEKGFDISRSAVHRHGSELEAEFQEAMADARRTRALAKAARESGDDTDDAMMSAASNIMQDNLLRVSLKLKNAEGDLDETAKTLSLISRAFADVGRMDIQRQKWQQELRSKVAAKMDALEGEAKAGKGKFDLETLKRVREELYGIV